LFLSSKELTREIYDERETVSIQDLRWETDVTGRGGRQAGTRRIQGFFSKAIYSKLKSISNTAKRVK